MANDSEVEFCGELRRETQRAYLVNDGVHDVWIPKSQVMESECLGGRDWVFYIPEWLAKEKGII